MVNAPPGAPEGVPTEIRASDLIDNAELTLPPGVPKDPDYLFGCTTRRHRVRLEVDGGIAKYSSWDAAQEWDETPSLSLTGATESVVADDCRATSWTFTNEGITYEVRVGGCDRPDSPPPGPWTGKLVVKKGTKVLSQRDCGPSGSMTREGWSIVWRPGFAKATRESTGKAMVLYSDKEETFADGSMSREEHTLLSIVGPYVSFAVDYYAEGGAHPSYGMIWKVIDISQPENPLDLRELFGEQAVFEALKSAPAILAATTEKNPRDLDTLLGSLDGGCSTDMGPRMLLRFAFHHVSNHEASVAVGIGHGCETERGNFTIVPLTLAAPERLSLELQFASQAGSLMQMLAP